MSSFTISTTEKNKPLLILNGFNYTIDRSTDKNYIRKNEHNHPASAVNNEVRLFQDKILSGAANTTESTQRVINQCLNDVSDQMVARLPNFKYIKRNIQRQR